MIEKFGIGIDIVDITRFEKIPYSKKPGFYEKIFLPSEIQYCLKYKNSNERFAGKFAIKEAVKKSINVDISLLKIKTSHYHDKPQVEILDKKLNKFKFICSISHDGKFAIGIVLSEKSKQLLVKR